MLIAVIYCRISRDREGTEIGVENQEAACRKLAKSLGFQVLRVYIDNDRGASTRSKKSRPEYAAMLRAAERKEFDAIFAYSNSRLTRRPREFEGLIDLYESHGIRIHTVSSSSQDLSTAEGRATARTIAAWDAAEAERTGERVTFAQAGKLARGEDLGGPRPFGFEKDRKTPRPAEVELLKTAYAMVLKGASLYAVTKVFTASNIKRDRAKDSAWRPQTVRSILLRERNVGRLVVRGAVYSDALPALVDVETFEAARSILLNPSRAPKRGPKPMTWAAIGVVRCAVCGGYLSQTGARKGTNTRGLRCAADGRPEGFQGMSHPTMRAENLDRELSLIALLELIMRSQSGKALKTPETPIEGLRLQLAEAVRVRDVAQENMYAPGANIGLARKAIAQAGQRIETLQAQLDTAMAGDLASSAIEVAASYLSGLLADAQSMTPEQVARAQDESDDDYHEDTLRREWLDHWASLSVEDRRTLVIALDVNPKLALVGQGDLGFRLTWDRHGWNRSEMAQEQAR